MPKYEECRNKMCGAKLKHDKTSDQYDPEYCSGKCRAADGAEPYVKSAEEQAMVVEVTKKRNPASYEGYKKNHGPGAKYARRFEPEKLNWTKNVMSEDELEQAGFRANRVPIPGDWDYEAPALETKKPATKPPTEWETIKATAKELGINILRKNKETLLAEIAAIAKEAENA